MDTLEAPGHRGAIVDNAPRCDCGWLDQPGSDPTGRWWKHALGAIDTEPPMWLLTKSDVLRDQVREMITSRPEVALKLLAEIDRWTGPLAEEAVTAARAQGSTWADVGAALGVSRQAAHERFRAIE
ncbi:hypothetical protein [Actinokineospora pegani]|uniref:hypothetical protein n=1 Tax=Actinokineospora pegani TaxID=2654637 RepID=UPI0012EA2424|nr:hypothetical protein [Actinokineospora pegani]